MCVEGDLPPTVQFYETLDTVHLPHTGAIITHYWAATNNLDNIRETVSQSGEQSMLVSDFHGNTPLHYAAICSAFDTADFLVKIFPNQHFLNKDKISPAHLAARMGNVKMLEILKSSPVQLNARTKKNWSPLHFAVFFGHEEAVDYLIENSDKSALNELTNGIEGNTELIPTHRLKYFSALDLAKLGGNTKIIQSLINANALSSLHAATFSQNLAALSYFLFSEQSKFRGNMDARSEYRNCTALHIAASYGYYQIAHSLLQSGCSTDVQDVDGFTPLELAVISNSLATVKVISLRCSPDMISQAIFLAADLGKIVICIELLKSRPNPNAYNKDGDTLLIHLLKLHFQPTFIELLIDLKPDLSLKDAKGARAIHYAATINDLKYRAMNAEFRHSLCNDHIENDYRAYSTSLAESYLVKYMIDYGDKNVVDDYGLSPLVYAQRKNNQSAIDDLSSLPHDSIDAYGLSPYLYSFFTDNGADPLRFCPQNGNSIDYTIFALALREMVNVDNPKKKYFDYKTNKYIEYEVQEEYISTADKKKNRRKYSKEFYEACNSDQLTNFLQAEPEGVLQHVSTIHFAVVFGTTNSIINALLSPDLISQGILLRRDSKNRIPAMYSLLCDGINVPSKSGYILSKQLNSDIMDSNGNYLVHYIKRVDIFRQYFKEEITRGPDSPFYHQNVNGENPVHILCRNNYYDVLKEVLSTLENDSLLSQYDNQGLTPLDHALIGKSLKCIDILHAHGVENRLVSAILTYHNLDDAKNKILSGYPINSFDKQQWTALHAAVSINSIELVKVLLENGADISKVNSNGHTPLHIAAENNNFEMIQLLLRQNMNICTILSENQPFLIATDKKCRDFLYTYWKRQKILLDIFDMNDLLKAAIDSWIPLINSLISSFDQNSVLDELPNNLLRILQILSFISEQLAKRKPSSANPFNCMTSMHHIFQIFSTIKISGNDDATHKSYATLFIHKISQVAEYIYNAKGLNFPKHLVFFGFLFPFQFVNNMFYYLNLIYTNEYMLTGIDNKELFANILTALSSQTEIAKIRLVQDAIIMKLKNDVGENCYSTIQNFSDVVSVYANTKISDIVKVPMTLFRPQFFCEMPKFFESMLPLPRGIPFGPKDRIHVFIVGDTLVISNSREFITIPLLFCHVKVAAVENEYNFTTPAGSFKLIFDPNDPALRMFAISIQYLSSSIHHYYKGKIYQQINKDKLFNCLVIYQIPGEKNINTRFMLVRAGKPEECFDVCLSHIIESSPADPVFFNVRTLEMGPTTPSLLVI